VTTQQPAPKNNKPKISNRRRTMKALAPRVWTIREIIHALTYYYRTVELDECMFGESTGAHNCGTEKPNIRGGDRRGGWSDQGLVAVLMM
jgi:hypothetical protein